MAMVTIEAPDGSERQCVDAADLVAYPDWTVVADGAPTDPEAVIVDGAWVVPLAVLQERRSVAVMARMASAFATGFAIPDGPLAGKVLQVRDVEDRTNWLTSSVNYQAAIAAGLGDAPDQATFRTAANETVTTTFNEGLRVLLAMGAWGKALMANSWALKDAIAAAADEAALAAIDIEAGWE